jgi:phosphate-selective porin
MRKVTAVLMLVAATLFALDARAQTQGKNSSDESSRSAGTEAAKPAPSATNTSTPPAQPASTNGAGATAPAPATREEVEELRQEVAELKAVINKLLASKEQPAISAAKAKAGGEAGTATVAAAQPALPAPPVATMAVTSAPPAIPAADAADSPEPDPVALVQAKQDQKGGLPLTAGWNGEHFFIRSTDGQFQLSPYGYVQTDYRAYNGDGAPANTFAVRRARFGFQGNYGDHFQYALLTDAASSGTGATGAIVRDVYLNTKIIDQFQFQAGQFKEPFAQEAVAGITNIDFVDRGLQSLLYPSAATAFRSPGIVFHGDINGGVIQYWAGIFNGHGYATATNTTSVPETVGRLRLYPWRNHKGSIFQGLALGGSMAYSYSRGLSNEMTPPVPQPDGAYTFFPQFPINGNVWRGEGEFTYLYGPWAVRGEYVQAQFNRTGVGTLEFGGLGFGNLPTVRFKAWDIATTYLLTGEKRPENGTPRVKHPLFGPETPGGSSRGWGAFELAFRYTGIQGNEPGIFFNNTFTPQLVPTFDMHTDEFSAGLNWYPNYWVRLQSNFNIDRLKQPSTIGALPQNYFVFEQRLQFRF